MKSLFITFEGGEGSGKTTQIQRLKVSLEGKGYSVLSTREPGGTPKAEAIRQIILSGQIKHMGSFSEALMFFVARLDHVVQVIEPALKANTIVLCDRFSDSTLVYQGIAHGLDILELKKLEKIIVGSLHPDLTFILDIPEIVGLERAKKRQLAQGEQTDRFEAEDQTFHRTLRQGFLDLAKIEPERCVVIDATCSEEDIAKEVWENVCLRL